MDNKHSLRAMPIIAFARKFALIFMLICSFNFNSIVFGADEIYTYNTSWDDNFLGVENIKLIFNTFGYTSYSTSDLNNFYNNFVENYSQLKIIYPDIRLYNLLFYQTSSVTNSATLAITASNGTFGSSSIPYAKLIRGANATNINWVQDFNSSGTHVQSFVFSSVGLAVNKNLYNGVYTASYDETNDEYILDGNIFSFYDTYTLVYEDKFAFMNKSIPGLLIADNEYLKPEIPEEPEEPDNPSGDIGTGDYTGQLNQIQGSLNNIENKIPTSGDMQEIVSNETDKVINFMSGDADFNKEYTSGEILERIDFEPIENPYANFWLELTNILNDALTGTSNGYYMNWFGKNYLVTTDMIIPDLPEEFRIILATISTTALVIIMAKWIKIITDKISSGSVDELLEMSEEGIVNLF